MIFVILRKIQSLLLEMQDVEFMLSDSMISPIAIMYCIICICLIPLITVV